MNWKGVWVATVSPFHDDGNVDLVAYEQLLRRLSAEGVAGFVPCATTGEGSTLAEHERQDLISMAVKVAKEKGLRVIAGCNSNDTKQVIRLTQEASSAGCDAALVVTPYYNKPTPAGLIAHYQAIADTSPIPILLYNVPGRTSVNLLPDTVAKLFSHPKIQGIKEASGNHAQWLSLMEKTQASGKAILSGDDDALATILALGGVGIVSATANVTAVPFVKIYALIERGDFRAAFELQKKYNPLIQAMFLETNPAPAKYALKQMGQMKDAVRLPLVGVTPGTRNSIDTVLRSLELL